MQQQLTSDNVMAWLRGRRSIRRYEERPVPMNIIEQLLTAAAWAPSAHNRQPWRFTVIIGPNSKRELALAMGAKLRKDLIADEVDEEVIKKDIARSYGRITGAPVLILVSLTMKEMDDYPDDQRQRYEQHMAIQSTAMAGQNMLLAAHAHGLGACWMCAPLFCPELVRDMLHLPLEWQPQGLVTIGYPAEQKNKARKALSDLVNFIHDGDGIGYPD